MDIKDLKNLIKIITENDITEFEMETAGEKVRIQRGKSPEIVSYALPQAPLMQAQMPPPAASLAAEPHHPAGGVPVVEPDQGKLTITSPIVGTMYRAPAPEAPPYVEVGQVVEKGQVLCIVEAMKLMNEIEAEVRCKIVRICKENAQPVEYGDALFVVEPL
ncbi:MAG: acetyl-CoA carboxylase biotin carboxyl carrier protein [Geobacteraceae bacterium]|nr:acetyl-CoA carboxylase biotin carboxyl carrier protein [Geobacteraceae bacterium]